MELFWDICRRLKGMEPMQLLHLNDSSRSEASVRCPGGKESTVQKGRRHYTDNLT